ncbi:MAG: hypothetical protein ACTSU5_20950, partial [Promethearchaeota archaeon]
MFRPEPPYSPADTTFEEYLVETTTRLLESIGKAHTREEKFRVLDKLIQNNLFLLRRLRDPGFYRYLGKEMLDDPKFEALATQYVAHEVLVHVGNPREFFNPFLTLDRWEVTRRAKIPPTLPPKAIGPINWRLNPAISAYYWDRLAKAKAAGNVIEAQAISILIRECETGRFKLGEIVAGILEDPYAGEPVNREAAKSRENFVLRQNVPLWELYQQTSPPDGYMLFQGPEYEQHYCWVQRKITELVGLSPEEAITLNKFTKDIVSILSLKWFDLKSPEEKWRLLAGEYEYEWSKGDFLEFASVLNSQELDGERLKTTFASAFSGLGSAGVLGGGGRAGDGVRYVVRLVVEELARNGYWGSAAAGYEYLVEQADGDDRKLAHYSNIAYARLMMGQFEEALKYYRLARGCLGRGDDYTRCIILKNEVLCHQHLGHAGEAGEILGQLEGLAGKLELGERASFLWNLANLYRSLRRYRDEYETLHEAERTLVDLEGMEALEGQVRKRLSEVDAKAPLGCEFGSPSFQRHETELRVGELVQRFDCYKRCFQFSRAARILREALELSVELPRLHLQILNFLVEFTLLLGDMAEFLGLEPLLERARERSPAMGLLHLAA